LFGDDMRDQLDYAFDPLPHQSDVGGLQRNIDAAAHRDADRCGGERRHR
jgi:hypothetical protein